MADRYVAYVGSYTRGDSEGITILDLDAEYAGYKIRGAATASPAEKMGKTVVELK